MQSHIMPTRNQRVEVPSGRGASPRHYLYGLDGMAWILDRSDLMAWLVSLTEHGYGTGTVTQVKLLCLLFFNVVSALFNTPS